MGDIIMASELNLHTELLQRFLVPEVRWKHVFIFRFESPFPSLLPFFTYILLLLYLHDLIL